MDSAKFARVETCLFDLDDTLYPLSAGLAPIVIDNIKKYMVNDLGFDAATVDESNYKLFKAYGTTMAGLRAVGHKFDFDDFHDKVHGCLPYELLRPHNALKSILHSMPQRKLVFTNGDQNHAARCLKALDLLDCFDKVICFENLNQHRPFSPPAFIPTADSTKSDPNSLSQSWMGPAGPHVCCKPQIEAFVRALDMAGAKPSTTIFFDDSSRNIAAAKRVGLHTVLVGTSVRAPGADVALESIHNVRDAIPELWGDTEVVAEVSNGVSVEAVRA